MYFETECAMAIRNPPRSLTKVWIESEYTTSCKWSTYVLSCLVNIQRTSIYSLQYAERCTSCSKSVRPSVCPSHAGTVSKRDLQSLDFTV